MCFARVVHAHCMFFVFHIVVAMCFKLTLLRLSLALPCNRYRLERICKHADISITGRQIRPNVRVAQWLGHGLQAWHACADLHMPHASRLVKNKTLK